MLGAHLRDDLAVGSDRSEAVTGEDPGSSAGLLTSGQAYRSPLIVALVGILVTIALTWTAAALNSSNERKLLKLRAKEVAAALTGVLPEIQTPLGSAAALADATGGNRARFTQLISPYVGLGGAHPFVSFSLWRTADPGRGPVAVAGSTPVLLASPATAAAFLRAAAARPGLSVVGLLSGPSLRLGYAYSGGGRGQYVAYGESALPRSRLSPVPSGSAYSDLDFALYLGRTAVPSKLLLATVRHVPLSGSVARVSVPFGNQYVTVGVAARSDLGGSLPGVLPWAIAIVGLLLTLGAALLTTRLVRDRRRAVELAVENQRLYGEQRGIAQTLQHALLPEALPALEGVEIAASYEAGVEGIEIGGDWYDLIAVDDSHLLLIVGDVSGRGLRAATAMAALRFAIHYAAREEPPEVFLPKLSTVRELREGKQLATILCALIDLRNREIQLTNAGHLPPVMISNGRVELLEAEVGLPIGVNGQARYASTSFLAPEGATLLGFTDGLVERRGEVIDEGLDRLRRLAGEGGGTLDELISRLLVEMQVQESGDDAVIAGVRWLS